MDRSENAIAQAEVVNPFVKGKFGKVLILNNQTDTEQQELEDAHFSNSDSKWYSKNDILHPEYSHYIGNKFWLGFKFTTKDKNGEDCNFSGKFLPPMAHGDLAIPKPDNLYGVEQHCTKLVTELFNLDEVEESLKMRLLQNTPTTAAVAFFITPELNIFEQNLVLVFLPAISLLDEYLKVLQEEELFHFKQILTLGSLATDVIQGKEIAPPAWTNIPHPKIFSGFLDAISRIRSEALNLTSEEKATPMLEKLSETFSEWKELEKVGKTSSVPKGFQDLHFVSYGGRLVLEMILLSAGVHVQADIRETYPFKLFCEMFEEQVSKFNQLTSKTGRFIQGDTCNSIYAMHVVKGFSLGETFRKILDQINYAVDGIVYTGNLLESSTEEAKEVAEKFVRIAKGMIQGQYLRFSCFWKEDPDFVYDCIAESD